MTMCLRMAIVLQAAVVVVVVTAGSPSSPPSTTRNVLGLSEWAQQQEGLELHSSLLFKEYKSAESTSDKSSGSNWGLELKEPVPTGTVLLTVPRHLVLQASSIRDEFSKEMGKDLLEKVQGSLNESDMSHHEPNFWIVWKFWNLCRQGQNHKWKPWIQAMPGAFTRFSKQEQDCLPYYAKYAAEYQDKKLEAFGKAAQLAVQGSDKKQEWNDTDQEFFEMAFLAVNSRFWTTSPAPELNLQPTAELVPIGDMFNHRDPPNVKVVSQNNGSVNVIYTGDGTCRDLYNFYGQPSNPHRFLVIFGFVPSADDMPTMWCQMTHPNNPFSADVDNMVFSTQDNNGKTVWDAVLYALEDEDQPDVQYTAARHNVPYVRKYTRQVLEQHVATQLQELQECCQKIDALLRSCSSKKELIRQHNSFCEGVFTRVQQYLEQTRDQEIEFPDSSSEQ